MHFNSNINSSSSKNGISEKEFSFLHKIKEEFKTLLYGSLYVVLKEEPFPNFYVLIVYIIYFFQLLYIPFNPLVFFFNFFSFK